MEEITKLDFSGIVLSPAPETPQMAGVMLQVVDYYYAKRPILGICLGHQALGEYFGMDLIKAPTPKHGKITKVRTLHDTIFTGLPESFNVVQYNSLILKDGGTDHMTVIAQTDDGQIMAIKHNDLPVYGLQFHPEAAATEHGLTIIKNWLVYNQVQQ